jgi:glutaminyl-tRNA synthetase
MECPDARLEPALTGLLPGWRCQFERLGYFMTDEKLHDRERPVFNRIVTLKDRR